jgi:dihydrofolate reductase
MKKSVYIATSLDGFIARKNGDIDWLTSVKNPDPNEDYGFAEFIQSVTCLVMGRHTFEKVMTFPEWPYGATRLVVMTKSLASLPNGTPETVELFSGSPKELVEKLEKEGEVKLYIDGGKLIQSFLRQGLIDEIILTRIPILIGEGIPLFGPVHEDIKLDHVSTTAYQNGLVQSTYHCLPTKKSK